MNQKNFTRITIDMLPQDHKKLKTLATLQGKSIREVVLKSIDCYMSNINESYKLNIEQAEQLIKKLKI